MVELDRLEQKEVEEEDRDRRPIYQHTQELDFTCSEVPEEETHDRRDNNDIEDTTECLDRLRYLFDERIGFVEEFFALSDTVEFFVGDSGSSENVSGRHGMCGLLKITMEFLDL